MPSKMVMLIMVVFSPSLPIDWAIKRNSRIILLAIEERYPAKFVHPLAQVGTIGYVVWSYLYSVVLAN